MVRLACHPDDLVVEIDPGTIVRLGKIHEDSDGVDPSLVVTTEGTFTVGDSIRTIMARIGAALDLCEYDDPSTGRPAAFALGRIAAMTKPVEERGEGDPTLVHLSTGETLLVGESIRTLSARLKLRAGIEVVDVDMHGTDRPAAVVPAHVASVLRLSGPAGDEDVPRCLVVLAGGETLACCDQPDRLKRVIAEASPLADEEAVPSMS